MLTVLFATYNRAYLLPEVLDTFTQLIEPPGSWKLIVVDNGSSDNTKQVIEGFKNRLPVSYLFQPRPGKNAALNLGLKEVEGDLVVLADDDVLPHNTWLIEMRRAADTHSDYSIFGGTILPKWEILPDEWLLKANIPFGPVFSITNPNLKEGPIGTDAIFGPNMAVRASIFAHGYRFDESIGPNGPDYPMGSESEFIKRLSKHGFLAWHCKRAIVQHVIRFSQMNKGWILRRMVRFGRGQFRLNVNNWTAPPKFIRGVPTYLIRKIGSEYVRMFRAFILRDEPAMFAARMEICSLIGCIIESRRMHGDGEFVCLRMGDSKNRWIERFRFFLAALVGL
jgi:glycosyltransferase involved in cell wall biosynthesis